MDIKLKGRKLNKKEIKKLLNKIFLYEDEIKKDMCSEFYCFYIELKDSVNYVKLTIKEREIFNYWTMGLNSNDIAKRLNGTRGNTNRSLMTITNKICEVLNEK